MIGFVVRRLRGRLPLATAALLTVLITTSVLTALVAFDRGAEQAGLRRALQGPGMARTTVLVSGDRALGDRAADDAAVGAFARELFDGLPSTVESLARSRSYGLPHSAAAKGEPDLTVLAALDRGRTTLLAGAWPKAPGGAGAPVETAVPQNALAGLGLDAGTLPARLELTDRFTGKPLAVQVTGVYRATDPADPYWRADPAAGRGVQVLAYTTYGPLLVDDAAFTSGEVAQAGRSWLVRADFSAVTPGQAAELRGRVTGAVEGLQVGTSVLASTELPALLDELASDALVSRSTLLVGALQLAVLAAAAMLLVVHLLADRQAAENQLLAARGASRGRVGAFAAGEAVLLALPAAVLAPPLTPVLLRLLAGRGPLAHAGLDTSLPWIAWPVAAACAAACVLLTALPALLRSAGTAVLRRAGRRQARVSSVVRSGADVALLVLAVVAYQQLTHYAGATAGVDPILVAAPTLALCAGTVLVLRVLPFAARSGERLARRVTGLGPALAGWQFARRPGRAAGPVLLLVLAVSIGMLAIGQRASWSASQHDQASFATAGGLRISGSSLPGAGQGGTYAALPGGERLVPVARRDNPLPHGGSAAVLVLDAKRAAEHLDVRPDLFGGRSAAQVFGPLAWSPSGGLALPGVPQRIELDVASTVLASRDRDGNDDTAAPRTPLAMSLLLRDGFGVSYRVPAPPVPAGGVRRMTVDLSETAGAPNGRLAGPLALVGVALDAAGSTAGDLRGEFTVDRVAVADSATAPAVEVPAPAGLGWALALSDGRDARQPGSTTKASAGGGHLLDLAYTTTIDERSNWHFALTPEGGAAALPAVPELTAVATDSYLRAVGATVGQTLPVPFGTATVQARVTASVAALPTVDGPAVAVDLAALDRSLDALGEPSVVPAEWWLPAAGPGDDSPRRAAAQLRAAPFAQQLLERDEVTDRLRGDPLGAAPQSALAALAVAAALLAAIGFAAAAVGAAAERAGEFAVLMALGSPRRVLLRTVAAEQGVLALLGLGTGLLLGALLVHLVVPLVVLTPAARRPLPEVLVRLPLDQVSLLAVVVAAALVVPALLAGRRNRDLTARLRHVEEM
ncbi:FtsX-like permease family protein [Streptomyces sp. TLI_171]|uniref:FtsX-like permease family protein n=1 Tax=Streptomyces sp. TLI_171 TaxID=1938859 RepID=UPI000E7500EC|nr:FtsX-like permease family protein [Streptomyces sp. TLI_171]RKE16900.1 ABC-type antimicrobial peptide transport system permease subunit [Streptomyces sp. TLI_171]